MCTPKFLVSIKKMVYRQCFMPTSALLPFYRKTYRWVRPNCRISTPLHEIFQKSVWVSVTNRKSHKRILALHFWVFWKYLGGWANWPTPALNRVNDIFETFSKFFHRPHFTVKLADFSALPMERNVNSKHFNNGSSPLFLVESLRRILFASS